MKQEVPPWLLENIAELSKHARRLHAIYVGFLVYCAFTVLTTADRKIILDEQAHLPIVNLDVPFSGFVLAVPIIAIFIFIDFQIHLQVLKAAIHRARTDYEPLERGRLYPWFGNFAEEPEPGLLGILERLLANLSLWWLMPIVLILVTAFTFKKHSTGLGVLEWTISFIGMCLMLWLWFRYDNQGEHQQHQASVSKTERRINALIRNWPKVLFGMIISLINLGLLVMIPEENKTKSGWFSVDLSNQTLVRDQKDDLGGYRVNLQRVHLDGANLYGSVLTKADLRNSQLQRAVLQLAYLEGANLSGADMDRTILSEARLPKAQLGGAHLTNADLNCANLTEANFLGADLSNALLVGADLSGATDLSADQLSKAASLYKAKLNPEIQKQICKTRPDLLAEPISEDSTLERYSPEVIKLRVLKLNELPAGEPFSRSPKLVTLLADYELVVLVKSGSDSYLMRERFLHERKVFNSDSGADITREYLTRQELTNPIIPRCYKDSLLTAQCN